MGRARECEGCGRPVSEGGGKAKTDDGSYVCKECAEEEPLTAEDAFKKAVPHD